MIEALVRKFRSLVTRTQAKTQDPTLKATEVTTPQGLDDRENFPPLPVVQTDAEVEAEVEVGTAETEPYDPSQETGRYLRIVERGLDDWAWELVARRGALPDEVVRSDGGFTTKRSAMRSAVRENPDMEVPE